MISNLIPTQTPFMGSHTDLAIEGADAVIFGAPHGTPYESKDNTVFAPAADALRHALQKDIDFIDHWDFDLGGSLLAESDFKVADAGNVDTAPLDGANNRAKITEATARIAETGAVPLMIGGDDSTPIPFIEGLRAAGPLTIVQIDAHIDWREERYGESYGFSSTMRRSSEMPHVERIIQVGMRGLGSARREEVEFAQKWGATLIPARKVFAEGIERILDQLPAGGNTMITFDCDGLDPSIMPAVVAPVPGGLTYTHAIDLVAGVIARTNLVGFDMVEFVPNRDRDGMAALTAARIMANVIGCLARKGSI